MSSIKPSQNEEEYFARVEIDKMKRLAQDRRAKHTDEDRLKLKELHYMRCPKCGMELHTLAFKGVEIERCYDCGAVVLDQGELEKLAGEEESLVSSIVGLFR